MLCRVIERHRTPIWIWRVARSVSRSIRRAIRCRGVPADVIRILPGVALSVVRRRRGTVPWADLDTVRALSRSVVIDLSEPVRRWNAARIVRTELESLRSPARRFLSVVWLVPPSIWRTESYQLVRFFIQSFVQSFVRSVRWLQSIRNLQQSRSVSVKLLQPLIVSLQASFSGHLGTKYLPGFRDNSRPVQLPSAELQPGRWNGLQS